MLLTAMRAIPIASISVSLMRARDYALGKKVMD
jgi:hypothetical protein